jgi:hypothetical protein
MLRLYQVWVVISTSPATGDLTQVQKLIQKYLLLTSTKVLAYYYKSTNTDCLRRLDADFAQVVRELQHEVCRLLALLVQKCKY